jgi:hypothetical protein
MNGLEVDVRLPVQAMENLQSTIPTWLRKLDPSRALPE